MRISNISLSVLAALVLFSCSKVELVDKQLIPQIELPSGRAPLIANDLNAKYIPGEYIIVFNDNVDVDTEVGRSERASGFKAKYKFKNVFKGFSASLSAQALEGLSNNPKVKYIEQDQVASIVALQNPTPSWGLDRIDQTNAIDINKPGSFSYNSTGVGVKAYIFDTGLNFDHEDFTGRISTDKFDAFVSGGSAVDGNGHGTHCAGTIGGTKYGIAKGIEIVAVKVLNDGGSGSYSGIIAGIDWAIFNHDDIKPAVGNMSLGGGASTSLDAAVRRAIADGIVMCVAAGNSYRDAKNFSPARVIEAITVGATASNDRFASYSNFGSIVDILAPGTSITSAWFGPSSAVYTTSGTSMATPHVAGVAALFLSASPSTLINSTTTSIVQTKLREISTKNKITSVPRSTVNYLLYSNF